MEDELSSRGSVLVIRLWFEEPGPDGLRARVLASPRPDLEPTTVAVASSRAAVEEVVAVWLDECLAAAGRG